MVAESIDPALVVDNLSYRYSQKTPVLDQVSFTVVAGQFTALLGPNGAGKSTLFALLTRLFALQQGSILFFDHGHTLSSSSEILASLGIVFQQSTLDLDLTVEQNLLYHGALHGLTRQQVRQRMMGELNHFNLHTRLKDKVRQLNGGHRRRLEIVRALLHQPRILLLDEPTVGLDLESRDYLNQRVRQLCSERGLCVLWATHLLEEVAAEDNVIVIHRGKIKAKDRCQALCKNMGVNNVTEAFHQLTQEAV